TDALKDRELYFDAVQALARIGLNHRYDEVGKAVRALIPGIFRWDRRLPSEQAAIGYSRFDPLLLEFCKSAVSELGQGLGAPSAGVRTSAVIALGLLGQDLLANGQPQFGEVVELLASAVKDKDGEVRREACAALTPLGSSARSAAPALVAALIDDDLEVA